MPIVDTYNYAAYSYVDEHDELVRWLTSGPRPGEPAPEFRLADLDDAQVQLSALRGRPVVIEFGSYTCPLFSDRVADMERLARTCTDATFLVIAVREAHPGEVTGAHTSMAHKRRAARCLALEEGIRRRVLVDDLDGTVHRAYGGGWNPVYVLDADGLVAFRRAWNHPQQVASALRALASGQPVDADESIDVPPLPARAPIGLRLLERGGRRALLDFYRTVPEPLRDRLRNSPSQAVREALSQKEEKR